MLNLFKKFFDFNQKELDRLQKKIEVINSLEDKARKIKNEDFCEETFRLKKELTQGKSLEDILPWSFALVREA